MRRAETPLFKRISQSALGWTTSVEQTYDAARLAIESSIPGDFVECGVYAGAQAALMALALCDGLVKGRRVHLYDTFAGIPKPGRQDFDVRANKGGETACSLEDVQRNMRDWGIPDEALVYHQGLFKHTMGNPLEDEPKAIAVLRIDADLYESTYDALENLYPLVSTGGYVIVDDFNLLGCRRAVVDYFGHAGPAPIMWRKHE